MVILGSRDLWPLATLTHHDVEVTDVQCGRWLVVVEGGGSSSGGGGGRRMRRRLKIGEDRSVVSFSRRKNCGGLWWRHLEIHKSGDGWEGVVELLGRANQVVQ